MTRQLLLEIKPTVVVTVGKDPLWAMSWMCGGLTPALPADYRLLDVELHSFTCELGGPQIKVVPSRHLTAARGYSRSRLTDDLERVVQFYEQATGVAAVWPAPVFAEVRLPSCAIAFGHTQTAQLFNNSARPADNHTVIIEFLVEDVDKEFERLRTLVSEWVQEPTTMPWGNRSILFRDPGGNLVNLFTPVTEEAIERASH